MMSRVLEEAMACISILGAMSEKFDLKIMTIIKKRIGPRISFANLR